MHKHSNTLTYVRSIMHVAVINIISIIIIIIFVSDVIILLQLIVSTTTIIYTLSSLSFVAYNTCKSMSTSNMYDSSSAAN